MKEKGFSSILILVLMFIVAGGIIGGAYYFYKSQSIKAETNSSPSSVVTSQSTAISQITPISSPDLTDGTDNWKTYTNNKFHYSFKYPSEFKIQDNQPTALDLDIIYFAPGSYTYELNNGAKLTIIAIENKTVDQAAQDLRSDIEKHSGGMVTNLSPLNKTVVGNKEALFYTYVQKTYLYTRETFINLDNNSVLVVTYIYAGPDDLKTRYSQWEDQILSTFKFTD